MTITIPEYLIIWLATSATIYSIVRVAEMITDLRQGMREKEEIKALLNEIKRKYEAKGMRGEE